MQMNGVHSWGRSYAPPGYICRDCSLVILEQEMRATYGRSAANGVDELDRLVGSCDKVHKLVVY